MRIVDAGLRSSSLYQSLKYRSGVKKIADDIPGGKKGSTLKHKTSEFVK